MTQVEIVTRLFLSETGVETIGPFTMIHMGRNVPTAQHGKWAIERNGADMGILADRYHAAMFIMGEMVKK